MPSTIQRTASLDGGPHITIDGSRFHEELEALKQETEDARRELAAKIERDRPFRRLADDGRDERLDLAQLMANATGEYLSGKFFLYHIGLVLETDPVLAITVANLRREWIRQYDLTTVPELLLLDQALLAYLHQLRLNRQLCNMEAYIDGILFKWDAPTPKIRQNAKGMSVEGLEVEDRMRDLQTQMLPVLERLNTMFVRNLRALRELKETGFQPSSVSVDMLNGLQRRNGHHVNGRSRIVGD